MTNQEMYNIMQDKIVDLVPLLIPDNEDRAEFNPACFEFESFGDNRFWRGRIAMPSIEEFYNKYIEIYGA